MENIAWILVWARLYLTGYLAGHLTWRLVEVHFKIDVVYIDCRSVGLGNHDVIRIRIVAGILSCWYTVAWAAVVDLFLLIFQFLLELLFLFEISFILQDKRFLSGCPQAIYELLLDVHEITLIDIFEGISSVSLSAQQLWCVVERWQLTLKAEPWGCAHSSVLIWLVKHAKAAILILRSWNYLISATLSRWLRLALWDFHFLEFYFLLLLDLLPQNTLIFEEDRLLQHDSVVWILDLLEIVINVWELPQPLCGHV